MSELLRATIALQDDSIHMLEAENKRLTARLRAESAEVDKLVNRLQESEDDNGRLQAKVEQLEAELNAWKPDFAYEGKACPGCGRKYEALATEKNDEEV